MAMIGVIGTGTWGIALARMLQMSGHAVVCWSALPAEVEELDRTRKQRNLPGMTIPAAVRFTGDIAEAVRGRDVLLMAVPSVYVRATAERMRPYVRADQIVADVAKGIEADTLFTMTEVIRDVLGGSVPVVALSGPTHAEEVARDLPTTIVSACEDQAAAERVQDVFMNTCLRVYTHYDVKGVELCGALKNIIALATGISTGLGYGDNAKAAIITRGLAEMSRLGERLGCARETFAGLAGMGDLIVTCTSTHSRNYRCGLLIGQGVQPREAIRQIGMVVEGANALPAAVRLARETGVEMPIISAVDGVMNGGRDPAATVRELMTRPKKAEQDSAAW